ncbi:TPA: ANR family transcriptional regulator [Pasteurella multocida]|nr:ANR family transcriptional regulator [Pasteurella multocida]
MAKHIELDFKTLSKLASEIERSGDYNYAASLWQKAASLARKKINFEWCINRKLFCQKMALRLF